MLKRCSAALAIVMMGAVLVGCGKKESPKQNVAAATDAIKHVGEGAPVKGESRDEVVPEEQKQGRTLKVQVLESWIGNDGNNGKQQLCVKYKVTNISKVEYVGKLNWIEMDIHGVNEGRVNEYTRKEGINFTFNPALGPGDSQVLTTKFDRKVDWDRGWFPYNYVEIKIKKYNFSRVS